MHPSVEIMKVITNYRWL